MTNDDRLALSFGLRYRVEFEGVPALYVRHAHEVGPLARTAYPDKRFTVRNLDPGREARQLLEELG